jgi:glutamate synthase (NADPH/NADH) small chain
MDQTALHELEEQCIQEHNPACMATCPARVDVRGICTEINKNDFSAALKLYRKAIPFPGIISRICDQPCRKTCVRKDAGEAIAIANLERACSDFGNAPIVTSPIPHREPHLAVIGAGLFGLTTAIDLAKKGYQITVFEKNDTPGGSILNLDRHVLPLEVIRKDFSIFDELGIRLQLNIVIENINRIDEGHRFVLMDQFFDAVLISTGAESVIFPDIQYATDGLVIDSLTYETSITGIFSGGTAASWLNEPARIGTHSPVFSISDGHRAATSIDRFFQHVSLSAARVKEGSYETRLFTSTEGIEKSDAVVPSSISYTRDEARAEAARCLLCQCLECVKVCEYLEEFGSYPKRYIREIYNNLSIVKGERRKNQFINSCSLCGLCGVVCPTNLNMGDICSKSRQTMVEQNRMPPSAHDFALRDMQFSNSEHFSLFRNQPGRRTGQYLFFPGCQLSASNPEYVKRLYSFLLENPETGQAGVGLALRCCGAPARWAGRVDLFQKSREEFLQGYESLGKPELILACSSCFQLFKEEYPEIPIHSLWDFLVDSSLSIQKEESEVSRVFALHDPCSTRYETHIHDNVRKLLQSLGCSIEELQLNREKTECCSYGGLMWLANRDLAHKVVERRTNQSEHAFVTYCAMCRDFFNRQGKTTYHILDLIFSDGGELPVVSPPDYSLRHANRMNLKKEVLLEIWKEKMEPAENLHPFVLRISNTVRQIMEDRLILEEDIQNVLSHAEKSGLTLLNKSNGHLLAYYCPAYVTYWVEYSKEGETFTIHNTYSHRMTINQGIKS